MYLKVRAKAGLKCTGSWLEEWEQTLLEQEEMSCTLIKTLLWLCFHQCRAHRIREHLESHESKDMPEWKGRKDTGNILREGKKTLGREAREMNKKPFGCVLLIGVIVVQIVMKRMKFN